MIHNVKRNGILIEFGYRLLDSDSDTESRNGIGRPKERDKRPLFDRVTKTFVGHRPFTAQDICPKQKSFLIPVSTAVQRGN